MALVVLIVCGVICTLTVVLTDEDGRIRDRWRRPDHSTTPAEPAAAGPSERAGPPVIEPEDSPSGGAGPDTTMAWTALDDLQLDRLLRHGTG